MLSYSGISSSVSRLLRSSSFSTSFDNITFMLRSDSRSTVFPYTTLFRSSRHRRVEGLPPVVHPLLWGHHSSEMCPEPWAHLRHMPDILQGALIQVFSADDKYFWHGILSLFYQILVNLVRL